MRSTCRIVAVAVAIGVMVGACAEPRSELRQAAPAVKAPPAAATPPTGARVSVIAEATTDHVDVYDAPALDAPRKPLANPNENGAPLVFLVAESKEGWHHVHLPVRPNGSMGWVDASRVRVSTTDYRVLIELAAHRITVTRGADVVLTEPVGVGTNMTPTPGGVFYIKELLQPPRPDDVYGAYAYGLSGFSNVLTEFAGGPGVVGIHGRNDPASIGRDVSHGCIRMSNAGITKLAGLLPLGTPVEISP